MTNGKPSNTILVRVGNRIELWTHSYLVIDTLDVFVDIVVVNPYNYDHEIYLPNCIWLKE